MDIEATKTRRLATSGGSSYRKIRGDSILGARACKSGTVQIWCATLLAESYRLPI